MHKPIRDLLEIIDNTPLSLRKIEEHSGVGSYVIGQWQRSRYGANLSSVIAVGDFLGYELVWKKKENDNVRLYEVLRYPYVQQRDEKGRFQAAHLRENGV